MGRSNILIKKMGGILYDIYRETLTIDPDSGADILTYSKVDSVLGWIQPTGTGSSTKGVVLQDSSSGDSVVADFFIFHEKPLQEHDRLQYLGLLLEVRAIEPWKASFMNFYKSYLVKVNNEDITGQEDNL